MKTLRITSFFICLLNVATVFAQKYFEGKVTYEISYEAIHPNATVEFLEENYGVKELVYYRKGHYKKSRLNKLNDTVSVVVYNPKTNTTYGTHISVKDTLMAYNSNDNIMLSYTSKDLGTHTINNYKAYGIKYIFDYKAKFYLGGQEKSKQAYYFSKDFPIHYKSQKDGFYNEIMQENPFLILKVIDNDFYIKVETKMAVKVERMKINKNMFLVDSSLPVKSI